MFVRLVTALVVGASLAGCATTSSQFHGGVAYSYGNGPAYYDSVSPDDAYFGYDPYYRGYGYGGHGYGPVYFGFSSIGISTFGGYCSVEFRACLPWWYGSAYDPYWRFGYTYGYGGYWNYYGWGGWGAYWPPHGHGHGHHDHDDDHDGHGHDGDHDGDQAGNGNGDASDGSDIFRPRPQHNPRPEREPRDRFYEGDGVIGQALENGREHDAADAASMRPRERPDWRRWQGARNDDGRAPMTRTRPDPRAAGTAPETYPTPRPWQEDEASTPRPQQWPRESRPSYRPDSSSRQSSRSESRRSDPPARSESRGGGRRRSRDDGN